jgi:hypothetical protein
MSEHLHLVYARLPLAVAAPAAPSRWLAEFLGPAFEGCEPDGTRERRVELILDPGQFAERCGQIHGRPTRPLECFTMDGRFLVHPGGDRPGGRRWFLDEASQILVEVGADASVRVVAKEDAPDVRVGWMRVLRELATVRAQQRSWIPIHGAALSFPEDRGVVFAGPKRSGKTTLVMYALAKHAARFVSNDRVFAAPAQGGWRAHGMPTILTVREDSLSHLTELSSRFRDAHHRFYQTIRESDLTRAQPPARRHRNTMSLSNAQFCQMLGRETRGHAPLSALVFPTLDPSLETLAVRKLGPRDAAARLVDSGLLLPDRPPRLSPAFAPADPEQGFDWDAVRAGCSDLTRDVPCYECRLGARVYRERAELDRFLLEVGR